MRKGQKGLGGSSKTHTRVWTSADREPVTESRESQGGRGKSRTQGRVEEKTASQGSMKAESRESGAKRLNAAK